MKRIITLAALAALTTHIHAATASDAIRQIQDTARHQPAQSTRAQHTKTHKASPHKRRIIQKKKTMGSVRHTHAVKRSFRTLSQYRHSHHTSIKQHSRHYQHSSRYHGKKLGRYVGGGWFVDEQGYYDEQYQPHDGYRWIPSRPHRQHGYRHYRRQWYLTYLYERAAFNDKHRYHYGYFDRYGFVFDGRYYRYDRAYTYQDRLHGKGLFEHRFYRPIRHHGFYAKEQVLIKWRV